MKSILIRDEITAVKESDSISIIIMEPLSFNLTKICRKLSKNNCVHHPKLDQKPQTKHPSKLHTTPPHNALAP